MVLILANLANLIDAMVHRSTEITGVQLLASSIGVWNINILVFSLLYWQLDRGGPEARVHHAGRRADWFFPQESAPVEDVPAGWGATYVDYLYLAYSTATAFSTTEVAPLTHRAKLSMMLESSISLATILLVAARAINILGASRMFAGYQKPWLRLVVRAGLTAAGRALGHGRMFVNLAQVRKAHRASGEARPGIFRKSKRKHENENIPRS
jgi:hypothetical protein